MRRTPAEQALERSMAYLQLAGTDPDTEVSRTVLRIVQDALDEDGTPLLVARTMDRLATRLPVPPTEVPSACPPIVRSSIGYDPD
ncbi:MAG: hypothetical protein WCC36_05665 [Gammaproteobacteria bacterium]